jgi:hypothetical protein
MAVAVGVLQVSAQEQTHQRFVTTLEMHVMMTADSKPPAALVNRPLLTTTHATPMYLMEITLQPVSVSQGIVAMRTVIYVRIIKLLVLCTATAATRLVRTEILV